MDVQSGCSTLQDSEMLDSPAVTQALARHPLLADSSDNSASSSRLCTLVGQRLQSLTVEHQSTGGQCNVFTSASLPGISIPDYARRLLELTRCSAVCAAYAVVYVQRLVRFKALALTPLAIHRCVQIAATRRRRRPCQRLMTMCAHSFARCKRLQKARGSGRCPRPVSRSSDFWAGT